MKKTIIFVTCAALAGALFGASTEKTIPVPKEDQSVNINFSSEGGKIESLRIQHYPDEDDIQKAKTKDLNDTHLTFWNFSVSNRSDHKMKMSMVIEVVGKDGTITGHGDKSDTVDPGKLDDNIRVWVRMKTLDIISAKSAKLKLSIDSK